MMAEYINCTAEEYHKRRELSSTQLADFIDDPLEYFNLHVARRVRKKVTPAMQRGTLTHEMIERGVDEMLRTGIDRVCKVIPDEVLNGQGHCKGKAWLTWKAENPARHYLKVGERNPFREILQNLRSNPRLADYLESDNKEVSIIWQDAETGLKCRCRVDVLERCICDWKTTRDNRPNEFAGIVERGHYARRLALYRRGVEAVTGERKPVMAVAIKSSPSFSVRPYEIPEYWLDEADEEVTSTLRRIADFNVQTELAPKIEVLRKPRFSSYQEALTDVE